MTEMFHAVFAQARALRIPAQAFRPALQPRSRPIGTSRCCRGGIPEEAPKAPLPKAAAPRQAVSRYRPRRVAHVIIKAREYDAKVGAWDDTPENGDAEEDPSAILEDFATFHPTRAEIASFIERMNYDEQQPRRASCVGRGTYETEEFDRGRRDRPRRARQLYRQLSTSASRFSPDYLEEGLEKMGFLVDDVES